MLVRELLESLGKMKPHYEVKLLVDGTMPMDVKEGQHIRFKSLVTSVYDEIVNKTTLIESKVECL